MIFKKIPKVCIFVIVILLCVGFSIESFQANAIKAAGEGADVVSSNQVCGDRLCSEVPKTTGNPIDFQKIKDQRRLELMEYVFEKDCEEKLVIVFRVTTREPWCVTLDTAQILLDRQIVSQPFLGRFGIVYPDNPTKCIIASFPINWQGCDLYGDVLSGIDFRFANLRHANLFGTTLTNMDLSGADFSGASLKKGNLDGSKLANSDFSYANLVDTKIRNADLSYSVFHFAKLWRTDFTQSDLSFSDMRDSNLSHAILAYADLNGTTLGNAGTWNTNLNHCQNHPICR